VGRGQRAGESTGAFPPSDTHLVSRLTRASLVRDAAAITAASTAVAASSAASNAFGRLKRHSSIGAWGAEDEPLTVWDGRKQKVAAVQERLNVFFGTQVGVHLKAKGP
jgi:hypothetical protein